MKGIIMKKFGIIILCFTLPLSAFAGPKSRAAKAAVGNKTVTEMNEKYKEVCGCTLAVKIDEKTVKSENNHNQVKFLLENIRDSVKGDSGCLNSEGKPDADGRKEICKMTSLTIQIGDAVSFELKGSEGIATIDKSGGNPTFSMMVDKLDPDEE